MKLFKNRKARADHYSGDTVPCPGQDEGVSRRDFLGAAMLGGAAIAVGTALPKNVMGGLPDVKPVPKTPAIPQRPDTTSLAATAICASTDPWPFLCATGAVVWEDRHHAL